MGTLGLALPWKHRIPPVPFERERRVESFRDPVGVPQAAADAMRMEDSALAAACRLEICTPTSASTCCRARA